MKNRHRNLNGYQLIISVCIACLMGTINLKAETVIYSQGFEAGDGGYTHVGANDTWQWGTPFSSFTRGPASAHSGVACWGTNLGGDVPYNSEAYLTSPSISLPALGANQVMRIRFFGWIAIDYMFDRGEFQVSKDGINWETKAELFCIMQSGWNEYSFDISDYAGGNIFLRFMCRTDDQDYFDLHPYNMAGFYVDDIAITAVDAPAIKTKLTVSGWETQDAFASCPWIFSWNGSAFVKDNDIFSTASGPQKEYTDYYELRNEPKIENGKYVFQLVETDKEESYIDMMHLTVVDHDPAVSVAPDEHGSIFTYGSPLSPMSATSGSGSDVLALISSRDGIGYKAYHNDAIELDFSNCSIVGNAVLVVNATGFQVDTAAGTPTYTAAPLIEIQTKEVNGGWTTRNIFYPRWQSATNAYDLHNAFVFDKKVRLVSRSCLTGKYHLIDFVGLDTSRQGAITTTEFRPDSAIKRDGSDIAGLLAYSDNMYAHTLKDENIHMVFDVPVQPPSTIRSFIAISKGYYIPSGTFFFYTWDGSQWVQRDGWSIQTDGDQTRTFDFSLWLPDPRGEYKVRIWQDFMFQPAGINFAGLIRDGVKGVMSYATDLIGNVSIIDAVKDSDAVSADWDWGMGWPDRNRWVEIGWTGFPTNLAPTTNPVTVETLAPIPRICWTYRDPENNPQVNADVEVWTGPAGTGTNIWDPQPFSGTDTSVIYGGQSLINGQTYYARVKAFDGNSWGIWSECEFIYTQNTNQPPVAEAGPEQTLPAALSCSAQVFLNGSGSYDPDGDILSYTWTGSFGTVSGIQPEVTLGLGVETVKLMVDDGIGGFSQDSVVITIVDRAPPVPDMAQLPTISGSCSATIPSAPTATDNCSGQITGITSDPLTYTTQGSHTVTWKYTDASGNTTTQTQTVIVSDITPPVPDVAQLPTITGSCSATIPSAPMATDNCSGKITGITSDPLTYTTQGSHTVTWKYLDASGNVATQTQPVIVSDIVAPVPDVSSLPTITGSCSATIPNAPTATDNCKGKITGTTTNPLSYSVQGTYTITWKYDDGNGNSATQTQTVIVKDNVAPIPDISSLPTITGTCSATISSAPTATDNCKGKITGTTTSPLSYTVPGTYSVIWKYDDGNGNTSTQTQMVVVNSGACCTIPTDTAFNYSIVVGGNIDWAGSGPCNAGTSSIYANGEFYISGSTDFTANIYSGVKLTRLASSNIFGNVRAPAIRETGSGKITGTKTIGPVAPIAIPNIDLTPYYNWALAHGTVYNGDLTLSLSRDTVIPGGVLYVNGNFKVTGMHGVVGCVIATGDVDLSGSGNFTKVGNMPVIVSVNGTLTLSGSGKITGLIYAKNGGIKKTGSGDVTGSLICKGGFGKTGSWATLTYTKFLPMPPGCN